MYCGYVTGEKMDYALGSNHPYPGRCTIFVSEGKNISITGPFVTGPKFGSPGDYYHHNTPLRSSVTTKNAGPMDKYGMSNYPCKINIEDGSECAPEPDEMCSTSNQTFSDCEAACYTLKNSSGCYDPCVMDCCTTGNSDPNYLESHMAECEVDECLAGIPGDCTTYKAEDAVRHSPDTLHWSTSSLFLASLAQGTIMPTRKGIVHGISSGQCPRLSRPQPP